MQPRTVLLTSVNLSGHSSVLGCDLERKSAAWALDDGSITFSVFLLVKGRLRRLPSD